MQPGTHYVRIHAIAEHPWDIEVDGNQLTFDRVKRILEANGHGDSATMTRAFRAFVKRWNIVDDDGKPIPITQRGIENVGLEMVTAITIEIVAALNIPKTSWDRAMTVKETGEYVRVEALQQPFGPFDPTAERPTPAPTTFVQSGPTNARRAKSLGAAYVVWFLLGLVGGHRYYLGRYQSAFLMTITIGGLGLWWVVDAFLLPGMVKRADVRILNERLK